MMRVREYGRTARIGVIVPPGSSTVEPEIHSLLPDGVAVYVSRLPGLVLGDSSIGLRQRLIGYDKALPDVASRLSGIGLDVTWLGHTASSYMAGFEQEDAIRESLANSGAGRVLTAADTIAEALSLLGCERLGIVSPYPDWLAELAAPYWRSRGFDVRQVLPVVGSASIYEIVAEQVVGAVESLDYASLDAVLLSGTGMPTFRALELLAERAVPVVSSNMSFSWWLHRYFGTDSPSPASRSLRNLLAVSSTA